MLPLQTFWPIWTPPETVSETISSITLLEYPASDDRSSWNPEFNTRVLPTTLAAPLTVMPFPPFAKAVFPRIEPPDTDKPSPSFRFAVFPVTVTTAKLKMPSPPFPETSLPVARPDPRLIPDPPLFVAMLPVTRPLAEMPLPPLLTA